MNSPSLIVILTGFRDFSQSPHANSWMSLEQSTKTFLKSAPTHPPIFVFPSHSTLSATDRQTDRLEQTSIPIFSYNFFPLFPPNYPYNLQTRLWFIPPYNLSPRLTFTLIKVSNNSHCILYIISLQVSCPARHFYSFWQASALGFTVLWAILLAPEWRLPFCNDYGGHYL